MIGRPMTHFGWRGWVVYRRRVLRAWKLDVIVRMAPGASELIALADAREHLEQQRRATLKVASDAARVAQVAARSGDPGPALDALRTYAQVLADYAKSTGPGPWTSPVHALGSGLDLAADPGVDQDRTGSVDPEVHRSPPEVQPGPQVRGPEVLTPGPEDCQPRTAKVRQLRSKSEDPYMAAVRSAYPDPSYTPTWSEVRESVNQVRRSRGLRESRSTIARVSREIREERATTDQAVNE
jgi:hypothetical protein